ncbi:MAG: hypothetical protein J2P24_00410 [Streptosporangiales bacterium]|nr:hypothetical protein [Streptosporangiales bacterium]
MASTAETIRLAGELRLTLDHEVDAVTRSLVQAWVRAWDELNQAWRDAVDDLAAAAVDGQWPSPWKVTRAERAKAALDATRKQLDRLAQRAGVTIVDRSGATADMGSKAQALLIASQLPADYRATNRFGRASHDQLQAIVDRTRGQVTAVTRPLSREATESMKRALVRGVAVGDNPRAAARVMLRRLEGGFNGGLTRAMSIARTEMLDANRYAAHAARLANSDVLAGWMWICELSMRSCPSCIAMHGSIHPVDEIGPLDHVNGRCTATPVTRSWRDLGIDQPEPEPLVRDARAWFDGLSHDQQVRMMGPARLDLYRSGRVTWDDLAVRRHNPGWRDSYQVATVTDLTRRAAA